MRGWRVHPWRRTSTCRRASAVRSRASARWTPLADGAHEEAHDADVHLDRLHFEARILRRPVVPLDRVAEAFGDEPRDAVIGEVGDEEAELVAAEARVQVARAAAAGLLRDEVVGSDLLAEDGGDAFDDPVADGVAERVVVPLEAVISTRPTAHQRVRCSSARNDSSCSMNRPRFISFVFGSRRVLSVSSLTSRSK